MKIYLDLVFLLNFFYDFFLLLSVSNILKRKINMCKIIFASLVGASSIFILLLPINGVLLLVLKILISIIMVLLSFKYISFSYTFNNLKYLYSNSIILAGFLYFLSMTFSSKHYGLAFIKNKYGINFIALIIIGPIILRWHIKSLKDFKGRVCNYYQIKLCFDNKVFEILSLFDSGNTLRDPITKKAIIVVDKNLLKEIYNIRDPIYIPYSTINKSGLMKCFKPSWIMINNKKIYNYLVGETEYTFKDGVKALLNNKLMEDGYV